MAAFTFARSEVAPAWLMLVGVTMCSTTAAAATKAAAAPEQASSSSALTDPRPAKPWGVQGQLYAGLPSSYDNFRFGALLRASYPVNPNIVASARMGYVYGFPRSVGASAALTSGGVPSNASTETSWSWSYVPVLVGARYYLDPSRRGFHADAELGVYAAWFSTSSGGATWSYSDTRPALNLGVGYIIPGSTPLDVMLEWSGYVGVGASLGMKLY